MKSLVLCFISLLSITSFAQSGAGPLRVDIDKMTYTHGGGGGGFNILLRLDANNSVIAKATACRKKNLTIQEQEETQIVTSNEDLVNVMKNDVIIAKNVAIQAPIPRGIWRHLKIEYTNNEIVKLYDPIVIINGSISYALNNLMSELRKNTSQICK